MVQFIYYKLNKFGQEPLHKKTSVTPPAVSSGKSKSRFPTFVFYVVNLPDLTEDKRVHGIHNTDEQCMSMFINNRGFAC